MLFRSKNINSLVLSFLYSPTLTCIHPNCGSRGRGRQGHGSLTSGGSLKRLSRKRPRLNSISRAEPLATVTRLRWFRENMLAVPRLCLPSALPAPPGSALSLRLLSLVALQLVRLGISRSRIPKLLLRRRHLGRAGRGTLSLHSSSTQDCNLDRIPSSCFLLALSHPPLPSNHQDLPLLSHHLL